MEGLPKVWGICEDPVWDWELSWNSKHPRLTTCFRSVLLSIIPLFVLWIITLLDFVLCRCRGLAQHKHKCGPLPWTLLAICKQAMTCLLIVFTTSEGGRHLYNQKMGSRAEYLSVCLRLSAYVLALYHQVRQRHQGSLSSAKLTIFWTLSAVCQFCASPLYDIITGNLSEDSDEALFVLGTISVSLVIAEAVLSHFTDPQYDLLFGDSKEDEYLIDHQAPLSRLLFSWMNRLLRVGHKNVLSPDDMDVLRPDVRTSHVCDEFLESWSKEERRRVLKKNKRPSLLRALARIMWPWMLAAGCLDLLYDFASLAPPIVLDWMITYMGDSAEPWWHGPIYAMQLFFVTILSNLLMVHDLDFLIRSSIIPRSGLNGAIYRKVFRLSLRSRRGYSLGELCNLLTVDVQRIFELIWSANLLWSNPVRISLTIFLLWQYLGVACLAGLAVLLLVTPLTAIIAARTYRIQKDQMEWKDSRLRLMSEILNGIKVLKLFAWEPPFMRRVGELRELETKALRKLALLNGFVVFIWILAPFLVALCSFVTFVLLDERNVLEPSIAFVSLTLFARLRSAVSSTPQIIAEFIQSRIAFRRVTDFLMCEEQESIENRQNQEPPASPGRILEMENASFSWGGDSEEAFLQDLTFSVERGDLVAMVGRVGAGKSALLSAILGEMTHTAGEFRIQKDLRVAYVSQSAWIQNCTLRQNILFISPMDRRRYDSVIRKCCLRPDLKMLPAGDHTEIGEKGVNLSGGQRQRVAVARAVYHEADVYLLDDPLSAVDAHVAGDIFQDVIGPKGMLAHKTRILVTHDPSLLPQCDKILLMSEGRIVESGSYKELMQMDDGELRRLVSEFASEQQRDAQQVEQAGVDTPSPDPSSLTTEELKAQMRRLGSRMLSRTMSVESDPSRSSSRLIDSEKVEVGRVRAGVYCNYFRSAGVVMMFFVFLGFATYQSFEVGSNIWLSYWSSDEPLPDGSQDVPLRNLRMSIYGILGFAQGACVLLATVLLALASTRASIRLHRSMLWSVMRSPLNFFETTPLGRILNRFSKDVQGVDVTVPAGLSSVVTVLTSLSGTLLVICINYPLFLLICLPIALLYIYLQLFYMATSRQLRRLLSVTLSPVLSLFSESVQGSSTIRAFASQEHFTLRHHSLLDTNCQVFFSTTRVNRWLGIRLQLMGAVIVLIVALMSVFQREQYSAALVGLTLSYALNVTDLLGTMVRLITQLETRMVSVERVHEYSELQQEATWNTEQCHRTLCITDAWPTEGNVVFEDYKMRYRSDSEPILKGINLQIPGGQKVGVVGRTGAGKSSLALALFRVVEPYDGQVSIDGIDLATLGLHDLRSRVTVIPQEPVLFGGDLRLNLDPEGRHSDAELLDALKLSSMELPTEGLSAQLDEGGGNLSVGQRQQVCLARALLQKSRVLVLDEATAAVDLETDRLIQETIREVFKNCTVITVAHRLHTVLDCDRILVMDKGRIVEDGPPDVLLKKTSSQFRELARAAGLL